MNGLLELAWVISHSATSLGTSSCSGQPVSRADSHALGDGRSWQRRPATPPSLSAGSLARVVDADVLVKPHGELRSGIVSLIVASQTLVQVKVIVRRKWDLHIHCPFTFGQF